MGCDNQRCAINATDQANLFAAFEQIGGVAARPVGQDTTFMPGLHR
jgi:hypothetical protein